MNTQLVPGSEEIKITLPMIRQMVRKQAPYYSDELINNIAQAIYNQEEKILQFSGFWDRIKPAGLIRTISSVGKAVGHVLNSGVEFTKNISFKNAFSPSEWRFDPVRAAKDELKNGLNDLGEALDVPEYLQKELKYVSLISAGALAAISTGGLAATAITSQILTYGAAASSVANTIDTASDAVYNLADAVDDIELHSAITNLTENLQNYDIPIETIIDNANNFENKITDAIDKMTVYNETAKNDLKNFINNEASISRLTGELPMDISGLLTAINTAPADLQDKLSKGLKEINARAESAMRMAKGVETLQNNFLKISKEAKDLYQDKVKLLDTLKTDGATNKFNLDEIRLSDYKNAKKMRVYQQLLTDKNQILKRLTSDVTNVKSYISDKTTLSKDEINEFKERIEYLEGELDYLLEINNANIGI